jgi:hypothetical protein
MSRSIRSEQSPGAYSSRHLERQGYDPRRAPSLDKTGEPCPSQRAQSGAPRRDASQSELSDSLNHPLPSSREQTSKPLGVSGEQVRWEKSGLRSNALSLPVPPLSVSHTQRARQISDLIRPPPVTGVLNPKPKR